MTPSLLATCIAAAVSACVGTLVGAFLQSLRKDGLKAELKVLKDQRIAGLEEATDQRFAGLKRSITEGFRDLEQQLDEHVSEDKTQTVMTELKGISKKLEEVGQKMDLSREDIASIKATQKGDRSFLEGLNTSFREHVKDSK